MAIALINETHGADEPGGGGTEDSRFEDIATSSGS